MPNQTQALAPDIEGYTVVKELKRGKIFLCSNQSQQYVLKKSLGDDHLTKYRTLRAVFAAQQAAIKTLYLPEHIDTIDGYDVFERIEGEAQPWSEREADPAYGGKLIDVALIDTILDLSMDLDKLHVLSDFYWRNFLFMPDGKIAVIDWERFTPADGSPSRLAYLYSLMFKNVHWQLQFVSKARTRSLLDYDQFRRDVLGWTARFLRQWSKSEPLKLAMSEIFEQFSNVHRYDAVWNNVDLPTLLDKSNYHVFSDLGQIKNSSSQIDCKGKLASLALEKHDLRGKKLLDVGCNFGWFLKEYAKLGAGPLVGVDVKKPNVEAARTLLTRVYGLNGAKIHLADILDFDAEASFDIVTSTSMFHYITDKVKFIERIAALLNEGGLFVLETPINQKGNDVVTQNLNPVMIYVPSREYVERIVAPYFEIVYFGQSNRPERRVFHFRKRFAGSSR